MNRFKIFLTILFLLTRSYSYSQSIYAHEANISQTDQKLIERFWTNFKQAINTQDKAKLASLIAFPFNCDFCQQQSPATDFYPPVTKTQFDQTYYEIFFDPKLVKMANETPKLTNILAVEKDEKGNFCGFDFSYISIDQSPNWEGQQHFLTIKKIHGRYQIVSIWTLP